MPAEIPSLPFTGEQLRATLVALEDEIGSGVVIPPLPMTGEQVRSVLVALEAEVKSGIRVPPVPMTGSQLRAVLVALEGATRGVIVTPTPVPAPSTPGPFPIGGGGRLLTGSRAPGPPDGVNGDVWLEIAESGVGRVSVWGPKASGDWGVDPAFVWDGRPPVPPPRRLLLENPRVPDLWALDVAPYERTVERITASALGGGSVRFVLRYGLTVGVSGVDLVPGGILASGEVDVTSIAVPVVPAGNWLWFDVLERSGEVEKLNVGVEFA